MKEFDIFIPLTYNDGSSIEPEKFLALRKRLLDSFNGFTFFPQPNKGFWKMDEVVYQDEIVVYRVVSKYVRTARAYIRRLKEDLKRDLRQEEIFIIERDVETL